MSALTLDIRARICYNIHKYSYNERRILCTRYKRKEYSAQETE